MQFYTYLHCKPNGEPFYVGKGMRRRSHQLNKSRRNQHHQRVVSKYGKENILIYVFPCDSEEQAFADEIQQISQLRREGYELTNGTDGGEGAAGAKRTEETKLRMSASLKGKNLGRKHTPETCAKLSAAHKGKVFSKETRLKLSEAAKGKIKTPEHCANMSASRKNPSAEKRSQMSETHKGKKAWNKGIPCSEETKKKISIKVSESLIGNKRSVGKNLGHKWCVGKKNASGKRTPEQCARISEAKKEYYAKKKEFVS